jgi:hypothetical protein
MENKKVKAEELRLKALETFSDTKKRKNNKENVYEKTSNSKRRISAVNSLQNKADKEMALRKEELELRRKELELKEEQLRLQNQQQGDTM